jgi:hypothetical protein
MYPSLEAQRFALALPGVWLASNQGSFAHLGGRPAGPSARRWARGVLKDSWGVTDADTLRDRVAWLTTEGHTAEYRETCARFDALPAHERESELRLMFVGRFRSEVGEQGLLAWDRVRVINVVGWGFLAGYVTEAEAWDLILPAARACQRAYGSWQELGRHYLLGMAFWGPGHLERAQPAFDGLVADRSGPWQTIPWATPLGGAPRARSGAAASAPGGSRMWLAAGGCVAALLVTFACGGGVVIAAGAAYFLAYSPPGDTPAPGGAWVPPATEAPTGAPGADAAAAGVPPAAGRPPNLPRASDWDGKAPLVCAGAKKVAVVGVTARFSEGAAIAASASCQITIVDSDIQAPVALKVANSAKVHVYGGRLAGSQHAVEAANASQVVLSGTSVEGKVTKKNAAKIEGP